MILAPPLPPSPSELAQPIASPEEIDQDLLASLKVIWGKHTDSRGDNIIRDLCSPPGYGIHAKAFYFLLGRYREETMRKRLVDGPGDYQDISRPIPEGEQRILRSYRPRAMTSPTHQRPNPALATMSQPASSTIAYKEASSATSQPQPSPVGPRPPPVHSSRTQAEAWRNQFQQDFPPNTAHTSTPPSRPFSALAAGYGGPRPHPPKKGNTWFSQDSPGASDPPSMGFAQNLQNLQERSKSKSQHPVTARSRAASQGIYVMSCCNRRFYISSFKS